MCVCAVPTEIGMHGGNAHTFSEKWSRSVSHIHRWTPILHWVFASGSLHFYSNFLSFRKTNIFLFRLSISSAAGINLFAHTRCATMNGAITEGIKKIRHQPTTLPAIAAAQLWLNLKWNLSFEKNARNERERTKHERSLCLNKNATECVWYNLCCAVNRECFLNSAKLSMTGKQIRERRRWYRASERLESN